MNKPFEYSRSGEIKWRTRSNSIRISPLIHPQLIRLALPAGYLFFFQFFLHQGFFQGFFQGFSSKDTFKDTLKDPPPKRRIGATAAASGSGFYPDSRISYRPPSILID